MLRGYVHFTRVSILVSCKLVPFSHAAKVWLVPLKDTKGLIFEPSTHHTVSFLGFLKNETFRSRALLVPVAEWNARPSPLQAVFSTVPVYRERHVEKFLLYRLK